MTMTNKRRVTFGKLAPRRDFTQLDVWGKEECISEQPVYLNGVRAGFIDHVYQREDKDSPWQKIGCTFEPDDDDVELCSLMHSHKEAKQDAIDWFTQ